MTLRVAAVALTFFAVLTAGVAAGGFGWDHSILRAFDAHYDLDPAVSAARAYLVAGMAGGGAFAVLLLLMLVVRRRLRDALYWALALGGALALTEVLKEMLRRPPLGDHGGGYSFPSGNATVSTAAVVAVVLLLPSLRTRVVVLVAGTAALLAYGLALVYLGWHYPSDVAAGWCLGATWSSGLRVAFATRMWARTRWRAGAWTARDAKRDRADRAREPSSPPECGSRP